MLWIPLYIVTGFVAFWAVVILFLISVYNRLVKLGSNCEDAFAQIEVQLKRRYDLIPNLVESVRG
jgi:LemA protein